MSLAATELVFTPTDEGAVVVVPVSGVSGWVTAIAAGGLIVKDVAHEGDPAQDPSAITDSSRRFLDRAVYMGTTLRIRMVYKNSDTLGAMPNPPLTIRIFGRCADGTYTALRNLNGEVSVPIPTDPSSDTVWWDESSTSDMLITKPDNEAHSWDCDGYVRFLIAVEFTYRPDTGTPEDAYLEIKIV
jgi:hypothetical protein